MENSPEKTVEAGAFFYRRCRKHNKETILLTECLFLL